MELLEEAERASRLLLETGAQGGVERIVVSREKGPLTLSVLRRRGRARAEAISHGAHARLRLGWNYSEAELAEALVRVYLIAARRQPPTSEEVAAKAVTLRERARRQSEEATRRNRELCAERARQNALELAMRQRLRRRHEERERARAEAARSTSLLARVLRVLGRQ